LAARLPDAFLDELRDTNDAEKQLTEALPKAEPIGRRRHYRDFFGTFAPLRRDALQLVTN
jgi:hypothetical protein